MMGQKRGWMGGLRRWFRERAESDETAAAKRGPADEERRRAHPQTTSGAADSGRVGAPRAAGVTV